MTLPALYLCLYAREFPAQSLLRLRSELKKKAVVVMEGESPLQTVCSLNRKARAVGLSHDMTKVEVDTFTFVTVLSRSSSEEKTTRFWLCSNVREHFHRTYRIRVEMTHLCA